MRLLPYSLVAAAAALVIAGHHGAALLAPIAGVGVVLVLVRSLGRFIG